jgi:hypothetical protein
MRQLAQQTGCAKSRVPRLTQAMARRNDHPESWCWATADGRRWGRRLVLATLSPCSLTRGVGVETSSEFLTRLGLATPVGCSPSALRGVMVALAVSSLETARTWEQDGVAAGEVRESIGAVDDTCLAQMMLVFQDVPTGSMVQEAVADDRTYATWNAVVDERLQALGTSVLSVVSDRATALMQRAEQGFACLSMPDCFPCMHDSAQSSALTRARQVRQAHQALTHAEAVLARHAGLASVAPDSPEAQATGDAQRAEVPRWEEVQRTSRHQMATRSRTRHPVDLTAAAPQTSAQVHCRVHAAVEAIAAVAERHQLPDRHEAMKKVSKQVPALAALVECWWEGVGQDVAPLALSPMGTRWARAGLWPLVSWAHQVAQTRCARRKAKMLRLLEAVRAALHQHVITLRMPPQMLEEWHVWATQRVKAFQRASSAVEGRNGSLSHMHHHHRGLPTQRYKVWTVLHHFDCRAADGTTPASRFFRRTFPDLFATVLSTIDDVPRPRKRNQAIALTG